jgi:hypothetical protein
MKKYIIIFLAAAAALYACRTKALPPRPTIPLVESIVRDTSGLANLVAKAGASGPEGSIAIVGEPSEAVILARLFQGIDAVDNIDGRAQRDSLPDFAGEQFDVILDQSNAPYGHYLPGMPDSLREAAVQGAMFAWDSTCLKYTAGRDKLLKSRAKILIFSSPLHSAYGLFDVDTLRQLCSGKCFLATPVEVTLADAVSAGAANIAVWASRDVRASEAYESAFQAMGVEGSVTSITPDSALDVRTELRSILRQYRTTGKQLDALVLSDYSIDRTPLESELALIRLGGTEEDLAFSRMLSPEFVIVCPGPSLTSAIYRYMRGGNLFTHRIARPSVRWYKTTEAANGDPAIVEVGTSYVLQHYVQDFD